MFLWALLWAEPIRSAWAVLLALANTPAFFYGVALIENNYPKFDFFDKKKMEMFAVNYRLQHLTT